MADDQPRRRRDDAAGRRVAPPLSARAAIYMDLAAERVAAADLQEEGSPLALSLAQEAIGYTAYALSRHLEAAYPTTGMSQREQWLSVLRFLSGTLMFQYPLETLTLALTELDRGIVPDGLKKSKAAQGGVPTVRKLMWMKMAIEVADEMIRQHHGHIGNAEAFMEDEAGVSASTIRRWRRQLAKLAPEHHPRSFRRWMPHPPFGEKGETDEQKSARLAPLVEALKTMRDRAKKDIH